MQYTKRGGIMNILEELNIGNVDKEQAEKIIKSFNALKDMCESRDKLNSQVFIVTHTKTEIDKEHTKLLNSINDFINNFREIKEEYRQPVFLKSVFMVL